MDQSYKGNFVIIDDDPINNLICSKFIKKVCPSSVVTTFTQPMDGIKNVLHPEAIDNTATTILLLDINMPGTSGWDVLDTLMSRPDFIREQYAIYMLSSSIATEDRNRANTHPLVSGFIEKPLTIASIQDLIAKQ
jgi:CheY-like chemotaxis protein